MARPLLIWRTWRQATLASSVGPVFCSASVPVGFSILPWGIPTTMHWLYSMPHVKTRSRSRSTVDALPECELLTSGNNLWQRRSQNLSRADQAQNVVGSILNQRDRASRSSFSTG